MLPAIKTAGGVSSLQKCGDAYQIVGLFFYGLSCCPAEVQCKHPVVQKNPLIGNLIRKIRSLNCYNWDLYKLTSFI